MTFLDTLNCGWGVSKWLIFSDNVFGPLVYYSHFFSLVCALGLGLYVYLNDKNSFLSRLFSCLTLIFSVWVFSDIVLWADENPSHIMFFWTLTILLEPVMYVLGLYFLMVFVNKNDISRKTKTILLSLILPTIIFSPTRLGILGFNYTNCDREVVESLIVYYGYIVEVIIAIWAVIFSLRTYKAIGVEKRKPFVILTIGMLLFFLTFVWGNISGTISEDWTLGQYGLFGMPIFLGFMMYAIVKFKALNLKIIGTQALVSVLWITLLSILFVRYIENVRVIVSLTLILFLIVGIQLSRSVKKEVEQREKIERLAKDLAAANEKLKGLDQMKSEFLSLATHQIRSPLTSIKGYASLLLEGDYGEMAPKVKEAVKIIYNSSDNLVKIVGDFLNISRIEQNRMIYNKDVFDLVQTVKDTVSEYKPNVDKAGLKLELDMPKAEILVNADKVKVKEIIGNMIDNAVKYTPKGGMEVSIHSDDNTVKIMIKDTGIGVDPQEIGKLFNKFTRSKDAHKTNVTGTGLGLYIAKKMITAQGGDIALFSEGLNKGTTVVMQLPRV